jgi:D-alanyl-D-alanine carboxypeptidase
MGIELPEPPPGYGQRMPFLVEAARRDDGRTVCLTKEAARAWSTMRKAAIWDGVDLIAISGFRSVADQAKIVRRKLARGDAWEDLLRVSAYPGHSEHHTGRAIDIGTPGSETLEEDFAETTAYGWLQLNAGRFGFRESYPRGNAHGVVFEPWHWCWHA